MYEFDSRVRYSEVDHHGTMTVPALINYFQDCSTFQSEDLGIGTTVLKEEKRAWLLSYWQVILNRKPELGEKITIGTFATEFKGLFGNRNFYMKDADGKYLACANSVWAFIDTETGRPTRPQPKDVQLYGVEEPLDIPYEGRKIRLPEETDDLEAFPVRKYHIDTNEHVNNCQYVQMAMDYLPRDLEIRYQKRILEKDAAGAMNCAEGFFEWMHSQQAVTREDIEIKILEMVMNAERRAFFAGTLKYNVNSRRSYIRELQSCTDIENLKKWFLDKTREICTKLENSKEKEASSIIDRAKEYINENFRRDISLDDVSREVDISPYYFSKLFKQETGKNFIEYLTEIRLKNARELLQDSRLSIKEICAQSGYSDPNYFSRIFKKYEGVTPSEFRERLG